MGSAALVFGVNFSIVFCLDLSHNAHWFRHNTIFFRIIFVVRLAVIIITFIFFRLPAGLMSFVHFPPLLAFIA